MEWDPLAGRLDTNSLEGIEAAVHLAGESIAERWYSEKKARIRESRVQSTRLLSEALASLKQRPAVLVCASAIGYYGDRGELALPEDGGPGQGFLSEVCQEWEAATQPAAQAGIRVVSLRIGIVLSAAGGALKQMLLPFRLGLGGKLGSGKQYMSWIALDDLVGAIRHILLTPTLQGPVNGVAPHPVTNLEFTRTLGKVLSRPTVMPVPAFVVRLTFGEMGEQLLLASTRVVPQQLIASGYTFRYPDLEGALQHALEE